MTITCPKCSKKLKLNNTIKDKLKQLAPGGTLRLPCPKCKGAIVLDKSILTTPAPPEAPQTSQAPPQAKIKPPAPPDITWLKEGTFEEEEVVEDIPQTLILMSPGETRDQITEAIENIGYQASFAESPRNAIEQLQFVNFASVILHTDFEECPLDESTFHQFMCDMNMLKRRFIFYILIGGQFSTLYDLEALANSANLVVNDKEIPELLTILRKAIPRYEELFGSLMSEISAYGG